MSAIKGIIKNNKTILENFSYITLLQIFVLISPLITYPYLIRTIGKELYGYILTAQIIASYATIIIRFGFDSVSSRHISINRDSKEKLQQTLSSILFVRTLLWLICLIFYCAVILIVPPYREHLLMFVLSYGMTFQILLFPQFFFQGIEKMKFITIVNVLIQLIFITLTFIVIKEKNDYIFVPVLYSIGYLVGGVVSLIIINNKYKIKFTRPSIENIKYHIKDASPLFLTDAVCTIKDKLNYILLGICVNMGDVTIYDFGAKLTNLAIQPLQIINTVIFPKMAREKNNRQFYLFGAISISTIIVLIICLNLFLPYIVNIFLGPNIDLAPLRLFLLAPLFLGAGSYIASNLIVARGYVRYMLYSIAVTTTAYLLLIVLLMLLGKLNNVMSFIGLTVIAYLVEMLYRLYLMRNILHIKNK